MRELDRRIIFLFVAVALAIPLITGYVVPPARMKAAEELYKVIENVPVDGKTLAFVAADYGPNSKAENETQTEVVVEHLLRRRIPVMMFSLYALAEHFLDVIPERVIARLQQEDPSQHWEYGRDWVNLGYRPGGFLIVTNVAKSNDLAELFGKDTRGNRLKDLPLFKEPRGFKEIGILAQMTGLVGVFDTYVQFFQSDSYRPKFAHGCTSITIPEAFIYRDSGQLDGLLEGIAGAAWYSELLQRNFPKRTPDESREINTGLGVAHLVVILLIIVGNLVGFLSKRGAA